VPLKVRVRGSEKALLLLWRCTRRASFRRVKKLIVAGSRCLQITGRHGGNLGLRGGRKGGGPARRNSHIEKKKKKNTTTRRGA